MVRRGQYAIVNPGHEYAGDTVRVVRPIGQEGRLLVHTVDSLGGDHNFLIGPDQITVVGASKAS